MPVNVPLLNTAASSSQYNQTANWTVGSVFTPLTDIPINAIYLKLGTTNPTLVKPVIYNGTTQVVVMAGPAVQIQGKSVGEFTRFALTSEVLLKANQDYWVAFYIQSGGNVLAALSNTLATYSAGDFSFKVATNMLLHITGDRAPNNQAGYNNTLLFGLDVVVPAVPEFVPGAGFTNEPTAPLNFTYTVKDPDANAVKAVYSVGNTTLFTDNAPAHNVNKNLNLTSLWPSLAYGKHTISAVFTDLKGRLNTQTISFTKLLAADTPLIESVAALQTGRQLIREKLDNIAALLGLGAGASLDAIIQGLQGGSLKHVASGTMPTNGTNTFTVNGLGFRPSIVIIRAGLYLNTQNVYAPFGEGNGSAFNAVNMAHQTTATNIPGMSEGANLYGLATKVSNLFTISSDGFTVTFGNNNPDGTTRYWYAIE